MKIMPASNNEMKSCLTAAIFIFYVKHLRKLLRILEKYQKAEINIMTLKINVTMQPWLSKMAKIQLMQLSFISDYMQHTFISSYLCSPMQLSMASALNVWL